MFIKIYRCRDVHLEDVLRSSFMFTLPRDIPYCGLEQPLSNFNLNTHTKKTRAGSSVVQNAHQYRILNLNRQK